MINKIIAFSIKNKFIVGLFILAWIGWGTYAMFNLPLNTVPDLTNNQVKVTTYAPDLATEEIERLITYPIELEMGNLPGLTEIRSKSKFGLSDITLVFKDDMGMYKPRQLVSEKLKSAAQKLPAGVGEPSMGPLTSGLGEIYQYVISAKDGYGNQFPATDLREIQDWIVKKELINIPGVVGVNTMGGYLKQYEVAVQPDRLRSYNLTITDIFDALKKNNANTGGSYIEKNRRAYFIRGEGLTTSLEDIRSTVIRLQNGTPLRIGDVATVKYGHAPRFGAFTYNGKGEAVGGKVMMLRGENPAEVIANVKERLPRVKDALPEGVQIEPFLDRSTLISETTGTVVENLALGALIVIFVLVLLMGNLRSGLITASVIPLSLLFALGIMYTFDLSANLISLGAVDFGIIIDGAVIIIEFVVFQISQRVNTLRKLEGKPLRNKINEITYWSSGRMMRTAIFGQLIILIVFVPILTLTGQEGKMFRPMAITFGMALIGAIILCLTYVPMMAAWILRPEKSNKPNLADKIIGRIRRGYQKMLGLALRYRYAVTGGIVLLFVLALVAFTRLGAVFIPQLDEGDFAIHPILQPGTSLTETVEINTKLERILLEHFPDEVEQVATKIGTGEIPTDPMSLEMAKMIINLTPKDEWVKAETKDELEAAMKNEMSAAVPGVSFFFAQPVEMLFNHLLTGSSADVLLNIYGEDLDTLYHYGMKARAIIEDVPGVGDLNVQKVIGLPQLVVSYDRDKLARYGLDIETVNRTIQTAYSGARAGIIYEGERQFSQVVRLDDQHRNDPAAIGDLYLKRPNGDQVRLDEVADIKMQAGPAAISRESVKRKLEVGVNIGDRDTESFVEEVQRELNARLNLPKGYNISYAGDFQSLKSAKQRLSWVVPLVLAFIFILLYFTFGSSRQALLVFSAVPLAAIGGVFSLWIRDMPFSISAGVGFIALFGIAVLNGVVLMSFFNELKAEGVSNVFRRVYHGTDMRLRPVILTALTDALGFLPMAVSASSGAEVQRPLATVVVGGLITATLLTLFLLPIIYTFKGGRVRIPSLNQVLGKNNRSKSHNMKATLSVLIIALMIFPHSVKGQTNANSPQKVSLEEAIEMAITNHPDIKSGQMGVERQRKEKTAAFDLPDTKVAYESENEGSGRHTWSVEQEFDNPIEYAKRGKLANRRIELSQNRMRQLKQLVVRDVKKAFNAVLFAGEKLKLMDELEHYFSELNEAGELKYQTGDISYLEKVSAQSKFKAIKLQKKEAEAELKNARNQLQKAVFTNVPVRTKDTALAEYSVNIDTLGQVPGNNPDLLISEGIIETARAESKARRAVSWPDPFVRFSKTEINGGDSFNAFEVGVKFPIDFWGENGRNQSAKIQAQIVVQEEMSFHKDIETEFLNLVNDLENYQDQLDFYNESRLKEARLISRNAFFQYKAGNIDYLQYVQYFDQSTGIQLDYLQVLKKYNDAAIELEYMVGR
ncbi:CusA/CzcA family heavy metal efflux RND transporter [Marinilabilia rubra]|uniref:CusA/CzcA family heavy metal efflux RND transporter n=1 Tax=Marinilabilia rubra TaxID=2162893 RepID=A0A2U2B547_9BACT|nr:CusA/CzcA family heavy metal efflux RND transporter [Marinilabilia rubra]PWD98201.1 CusA/CzcA family heavy metal efflux RND transporter [Marinilabilia rubra]